LSATLLVALLATQSAWAQSPSPSPTPSNECVECYHANADTQPTPPRRPASNPPNAPPRDGAGSSAGSINDLAGQRFNQMITNRVLGNVLLGVNEQVNCNDCISAFGSAGSFSAGIHGRKNLTPNLSLLAGIAYAQYNEGGYQRHQFADRRVRAALRFRRLGIVAAVLRYRHHPVAVPEGALRAQLHDEPRRGIARKFDHERELRRLWPRRLDEPAVAAR
jgi:hypothetical protein